MLDSEILEKLQGASIEERIRVIEAILRSLKTDIQKSASLEFEAVTHPKRPGFGFMKDTGQLLGDVVAPIFPETVWDV
jgi:hypothetical protein